MLAQLDADALEWLVPGFFEDKCLALVRALPKAFRRRLAPARDRLAPVLPLLAEPETYRRGRLAEALSKAIHTIHGVAVPVDAWREEDLPGHLRINIQVRDQRGRMLDQGRDLASLKSRVMPRVERSLGDGLRAAHERRDMTEFPAEGVPDSVTIVDGGNRTVVYPVLVDRGRGVDLLVQLGPSGRATLDRDGFTRLAMLARCGRRPTAAPRGGPRSHPCTALCVVGQPGGSGRRPGRGRVLVRLLRRTRAAEDKSRLR